MPADNTSKVRGRAVGVAMFAMLVALVAFVIWLSHSIETDPSNPAETGNDARPVARQEPEEQGRYGKEKRVVAPAASGGFGGPKDAPTVPDSLPNSHSLEVTVDVELPPGASPNGFVHFYWSEPYGHVDEVAMRLVDVIGKPVMLRRPAVVGQLSVWHDYIPGLVNPPFDLASLGNPLEHVLADPVAVSERELLVMDLDRYRSGIDIDKSVGGSLTITLPMMHPWARVRFEGLPSGVVAVYATHRRESIFRGNPLVLPAEPGWKAHRDGTPDWFHYRSNLLSLWPFADPVPRGEIMSLKRSESGEWLLYWNSAYRDYDPVILELANGGAVVAVGGEYDSNSNTFIVNGFQHASSQSLRFLLEWNDIPEEHLRRMVLRTDCKVLATHWDGNDSSKPTRGPSAEDVAPGPDGIQPMVKGYSRVMLDWDAILKVDARRREAYLSIPKGARVGDYFTAKLSPLAIAEAIPPHKVDESPSRETSYEVKLLEWATPDRPGRLRIYDKDSDYAIED